MTTDYILIAGSGRNVGKTTLMCSIIENISVKQEVTAVKISKHLHSLTTKQKVVFEQPGLLIAEELDLISSKDSSRYLRAGAKRSFFIQTEQEMFPHLVLWMEEHFNGIIVCETGYLGNFIIPRLAIFVGVESTEKKICWNFPFKKIIFDGQQFQPSLNDLLMRIKS
jgi:hypothetical protein